MERRRVLQLGMVIGGTIVLGGVHRFGRSLASAAGTAILGRHRARCLTVRLPMPPVRPVRETFASYGSRQRDIMGNVPFASSMVPSPWTAYAFAGYLCTVSRPSPSGPSPCT